MAALGELRSFLDSHRVRSSSDWNIIGLGMQRGWYQVPENEYIGFLRKVYSASQQGPISLMERHPPERTYGPILIDLDFRFADDGQRPVQRRITMDHIKRFIQEYVFAIRYLFGISAPVALFYVQQKPTPETGPEDIIKDGVHIMCSNLCFSYKNQFILRGYMMSKMNDIFGGLGCINDYHDMFHPSVIQQNNWFIYGCGKPDKMPYKLTYIHQIVQESSSGTVSNDDIPRHILNMSIRLFCEREQIVEVCPERLVEYNVLDELWSSGRAQPERDEADILRDMGDSIVLNEEENRWEEDYDYIRNNNFSDITWEQVSQWTIPVVKQILKRHLIDFFNSDIEIVDYLPVVLLYAAFPQECIHLKDEAFLNARKVSHCVLNYLMMHSAVNYDRLSLRTLWSTSGEDLTESVLNVFFHRMADGHGPSWDLYSDIENSIIGVLKGTITTDISIIANRFITGFMNKEDLENLSQYEHENPPQIPPLLNNEENIWGEEWHELARLNGLLCAYFCHFFMLIDNEICDMFKHIGAIIVYTSNPQEYWLQLMQASLRKCVEILDEWSGVHNLNVLDRKHNLERYLLYCSNEHTRYTNIHHINTNRDDIIIKISRIFIEQYEGIVMSSTTDLAKELLEKTHRAEEIDHARRQLESAGLLDDEEAPVIPVEFNEYEEDEEEEEEITEEEANRLIEEGATFAVENATASAARRVVKKVHKKPTIAAPTIPRRIAHTLIQEQVNNAAECPIQMELLTHENAAITGCYHFFEKDAIARWFQYNSTCPQCREPTGVLTVGP